MVERRIKGFFLGVPILSQGSYTEDERVRRDGLGYGILSLFSYEASDYATSLVLAGLCLGVVTYVCVTKERNFHFRLTIHILSSITFLAATMRSNIEGLAPCFAVAALAYYGLMYLVHFDR